MFIVLNNYQIEYYDHFLNRHRALKAFTRQDQSVTETRTFTQVGRNNQNAINEQIMQTKSMKKKCKTDPYRNAE